MIEKKFSKIRPVLARDSGYEGYSPWMIVHRYILQAKADCGTVPDMRFSFQAMATAAMVTSSLAMPCDQALTSFLSDTHSRSPEVCDARIRLIRSSQREVFFCKPKCL